LKTSAKALDAAAADAKKGKAFSRSPQTVDNPVDRSLPSRRAFQALLRMSGILLFYHDKISWAEEAVSNHAKQNGTLSST
jgi:hypothetical protein